MTASALPCCLGPSVSDAGFVSLLLDEKGSALLPPCGVDTEAAVVKALTLLQLLQDIDMAGPLLPPEMLSELVYEFEARGSKVRVYRRSRWKPPVGPFLHARSIHRGRRADPNSNPFVAVALALRYQARLQVARPSSRMWRRARGCAHPVSEMLHDRGR